MNTPRRSAADNYSGEQSTAYRRGFVLGLTLAETIMLLTFVVLLLLVLGFERRDLETKLLADQNTSMKEGLSAFAEVRSAIGATSIEEISEEIRHLRELKAIATNAGHKWDKDFLELVKTLVASVDGGDAKTVARQLAERKALLDRMIKQIEGGKDAQAVVETQARVIAEMEGRVRELSHKQGGVLPSCWRTSDDRPEYIFDAVLDTAGVRLRDRTPVNRIEERHAIMGNASIDQSRVLNPDQLLVLTQPLFEYSQKNECRFYVVVYDGTGTTEKARYKQLLEAVEGHFYKLLSSDARPY